MKGNTKQRVLIAVCIFWLLAVGIGNGMLMKYSNTANPDGTAPAHWPAQTTIPHAAGQATLIMFAHPLCPCTRASLGELAELMAHCQGLVSAHVVFFRPSAFSEDWAHSDLWRSAQAIPGVSVQTDVEGREASLFHGETSGHTMLYNAQGQLVFDGGITASRGHSGDNDGRDAIETLLHGGTVPRAVTPVFGCLILDPKSKTTNGGK